MITPIDVPSFFCLLNDTPNSWYLLHILGALRLTGSPNFCPVRHGKVEPQHVAGRWCSCNWTLMESDVKYHILYWEELSGREFWMDLPMIWLFDQCHLKSQWSQGEKRSCGTPGLMVSMLFVSFVFFFSLGLLGLTVNLPQLGAQYFFSADAGRKSAWHFSWDREGVAWPVSFLLTKFIFTGPNMWPIMIRTDTLPVVPSPVLWVLWLCPEVHGVQPRPRRPGALLRVRPRGGFVAAPLGQHADVAADVCGSQQPALSPGGFILRKTVSIKGWCVWDWSFFGFFWGCSTLKFGLMDDHHPHLLIGGGGLPLPLAEDGHLLPLEVRATQPGKDGPWGPWDLGTFSDGQAVWVLLFHACPLINRPPIFFWIGRRQFDQYLWGTQRPAWTENHIIGTAISVLKREVNQAACGVEVKTWYLGCENGWYQWSIGTKKAAQMEVKLDLFSLVMIFVGLQEEEVADGNWGKLQKVGRSGWKTRLGVLGEVWGSDFFFKVSPVQSSARSQVCILSSIGCANLVATAEMWGVLGCNPWPSPKGVRAANQRGSAGRCERRRRGRMWHKHPWCDVFNQSLAQLDADFKMLPRRSEGVCHLTTKIAMNHLQVI